MEIAPHFLFFLKRGLDGVVIASTHLNPIMHDVGYT